MSSYQSSFYVLESENDIESLNEGLSSITIQEEKPQEKTEKVEAENQNSSTKENESYVKTNSNPNPNTNYNAPISTVPTTTTTTTNSRNSGSTIVKLKEGYNPNNKVSINTDGRQTDRTIYTAEAGTPVTTNGITSSAPRHTGTYYKVQLIAVTRHDPSSARYNPVRGMARMDTELIEAKNITRVLLADYFDYASAKKALNRVREKPAFARAFLVKYVDGERIGRVK